jgi:signal transduction histidine kinase
LLDADPTRLAQVFANLLNNAAKYTPAGGRIRIAAARDGGRVVVRVEDSGVGIPADMLPKVFDMFIQVGRSIDRSQGGLGIGLTLVRQLVLMHGGTTDAASEGPGRGATFTVRLPLAAAAEGAER